MLKIHETITMSGEAATVFLTVEDGRLAIVAETVPMPPTAGVVAVQPVAALNESNVVPAGRISESETPVAASVPLFLTVIA